MAARSTFPLRFHDDNLRDLVREVAGQSGVSQNELIELAVLHEVVRRGLLQAAHLERAAAALAEMSARAYRELVERSLADFAEGEALPDPVEMRAWSLTQQAPPGRTGDRFGVLAAFTAAS